MVSPRISHRWEAGLPGSCLDLVGEGLRRETAYRRGSHSRGTLVQSHSRIPAGQNTYPQGSRWHQWPKLPAESCPRSSSDSQCSLTTLSFHLKAKGGAPWKRLQGI